MGADTPIKVLHISTPDTWRGGEQQLAYLLQELRELGVEQFLLARKGGKLSSWAQQEGFSVIEFAKKGRYHLKASRTIGKLIRKQKISLIHTHDSGAHTLAYLAALVRGNRTPLVVSRRVDFPVGKSFMSRKKYNHKNVKRILCVSDAIKAITGRTVNNKRVLKTVYSGIDATRFPHPPTGILRKEFDIPEDYAIVGNVAAIAPHKDYFTFVNAAEELLKTHSKVRFLIIGDGPMREEIKAYVSQKGLNKEILFTGFRNDIPQILPELDVFLFTSETEGLGTSILDAFACKVPVIATAAGGIPELVTEGETGFLAEIKNAKQLAGKVQLVLSNKGAGSKVVQGALAKLQAFSTAATAHKTLQHYREVLAGH